MSGRAPLVSVAAAAVLLAVALGVCTSGGKPIPPPPTTVMSVTSPPDPPDLGNVAIQAVGGKTTTTKVALTPGAASMSGQVVGPEGPVAGATVRIERIVGDAVGTMEVTTAEDGTWQAPPQPPPPPPPDPAAAPTPPTAPPVTQPPPGLLGGRYRVRARRPPDLALTAPTILFLGSAEKKQMPIQLSRYSGLAVTSSSAPTPPIVGELVNVAVLVTTRSVDQNGIVRALGVPAASITLGGGGGWQLVRGDSATDGAGKATFQLRCRQQGAQPLSIDVEGTASFTLPIAPCVLPPPSTTSSVDPGAGETTTTGSGETTTSTGRFSTSTSRGGTTTSTVI